MPFYLYFLIFATSSSRMSASLYMPYVQFHINKIQFVSSSIFPLPYFICKITDLPYSHNDLKPQRRIKATLKGNFVDYYKTPIYLKRWSVVRKFCLNADSIQMTALFGTVSRYSPACRWIFDSSVSTWTTQYYWPFDNQWWVGVSSIIKNHIPHKWHMSNQTNTHASWKDSIHHATHISKT